MEVIEAMILGIFTVLNDFQYLDSGDCDGCLDLGLRFGLMGICGGLQI